MKREFFSVSDRPWVHQRAKPCGGGGKGGREGKKGSGHDRTIIRGGVRRVGRQRDEQSRKRSRDSNRHILKRTSLIKKKRARVGGEGGGLQKMSDEWKSNSRREMKRRGVEQK